MATLFLILIYTTFISLGLPDSLLGTAWPLISPEFQVPVSAVGIISMTVNAGTIVSSLFSVRVISRFGTGKVTAVSVMLTAVGLLASAFTHSLIFLVFCAIPLGLGAGAIDTALNEYVAEHYQAHHMSWLHSFWGIGAMTGPLIMSFTLRNDNWRGAYLTVSAIQWVVVILLFLSLPLWRKMGDGKVEVAKGEKIRHKGIFYPFKVKGVWGALIAFFCYCAIEYSFNLWGSSFLVAERGLDPSTAASWVSTYYMGITFGRVVSGFVSFKVSSKNMIRIGQILLVIGALFALLPLPNLCTLIGFILAGVGCAPTFPCMLHETPVRFGTEDAQQVMGFQMGFAYFGGTVIPPLFGVLARNTTFGLYPVYLLVFAAIMLLSTEILNRFVKKKNG